MTQHQQTGMSTIELIISITLGLVLLSTFVSVIININNTSQINNSSQQLQENALFLFYQLSANTRQISAYKCIQNEKASDTPPQIANKSKSSFLLLISVSGIDDYLVENTSLYSDKINLRWVEHIAPVSHSQNRSVDRIQISDNGNKSIKEKISQLSANDVLLISDCNHADIFTLTDISRKHHSNGSIYSLSHGRKTPSGDVVNSTDVLQTAYTDKASIYKVNISSYFLKPDKNNLDINNKPIPTLFRTRNGTTQAFISNIDFFRVLYGEDISQDNIPDQFVGANDVKNWGNIRAIKIAVLMQTKRPNTTNKLSKGKQTIIVLDKEFKSENRNTTRHVFETILTIN